MPALPDISAHLAIDQRFCYPDWEAISRDIEQQVPEPEWNAAWESAARQWVDRMCRELGSNYQVCETPRFLVLTTAPATIAQDMCESCEWSLNRIFQSLEGVAAEEGYGKHVVLVFSNLDDYLGYILNFFPGGDHPMSGGMCLDGNGYRHFAFPAPDYAHWRSILVHELTHECLAHLPIPAWLNEALAMRLEESLRDVSVFHFDREIRRRHVAYWTADSIQMFWSGKVWTLPGDGFDLGYNLAQILWRKIEVDIGASYETILRFVAAAHAGDGGEAACRSILKRSLGDLVAEFSGKGNWAPNPAVWSDGAAEVSTPSPYCTSGGTLPYDQGV